MAICREDSPLISGNNVNRRRNAMMVASTGMLGIFAVIVVVVNSGSMNRSNALIQSTKVLKTVKSTSKLSSSQEREKEMVECVVGFGLVGAALCPSTGLAQSATHSLMSKVMKSAPEVVHTLAPVSAPKHIVSPDSKESLQPADAGAEAQPSAVSVSADSSEAVEVPIDCACCHSKCQKSGLYKDPKMKSIPHSFWCVKQGQVGSPSYCPAQDYNCLCCDRVRVQLRGQSCA